MGDETGRVVLWAGDVARMFGVKPRMVNRWAVADPPKLPYFRTPGGRLRFYLDEIQDYENPEWRMLFEGESDPSS